MKKSIITVALSVLLSVLAAYGVLKAATVNENTDNLANAAPGTVTKTVNLAQSDYPDLTYAAEAAVDAVVYVEVTATQQYQMDDPFFRFFFGESVPQSRQVQGSGSGVMTSRHAAFRCPSFMTLIRSSVTMAFPLPTFAMMAVFFIRRSLLSSNIPPTSSVPGILKATMSISGSSSSIPSGVTSFSTKSG